VVAAVSPNVYDGFVLEVGGNGARVVRGNVGIGKEEVWYTVVNGKAEKRVGEMPFVRGPCGLVAGGASDAVIDGNANGFITVISSDSNFGPPARMYQ